MTLSWPRLLQLCLVNMAIGGMSALPINLFNRLMTVELALPALLPGFLVALHYGVQLSRPVWGHRSDVGGKRTPFILGGMATLALGIVAAAAAIVWAETNLQASLVLCVLAYIAIGLGIGAAGTSFLALLAAASPDKRKGAFATTAWLMLIIGAIAMTVGVGIAIEPYSPARLMQVVPIAMAIAFAVTCLAVIGVEKRLPTPSAVHRTTETRFRDALNETWEDPAARRFTGFVFLSILAFFLSELIFEPFAGHVHGLPPEDSTKLSGGKDGAALMGMILAGALSTFGIGSLRFWAIVGCLISAAGLFMLGAGFALLPSTITLGLGNGIFVVGAIGSMMRLAAAEDGSTGTRMGLFGASQAVAAGLAGLLATATLDLARLVLPDAQAYGTLFAAEAVLFLAAAWVAHRILATPTATKAFVPGE